MSEHLTPHLRYYSTYGPTDDHGARSTVLFFLNDDLATSCFLRVVSDEMARAKVDFPCKLPTYQPWNDFDRWEHQGKHLDIGAIHLSSDVDRRPLP